MDGHGHLDAVPGLCRRVDVKREQLWPSFVVSFRRWALGFLVWHVGYLSDNPVRKRCFRLLRERWLPELGCFEDPSIYSVDKLTQVKYLMARYAPYPIFTVAMRIHQARKRGQAQRYSANADG